MRIGEIGEEQGVGFLAWISFSALIIIATADGAGVRRTGGGERPHESFQAYTPRAVEQGYTFTILLSDQGVMGNAATQFDQSAGTIGSKYPADIPIEHLQGLGFYIGALVDTGPPGRPLLAKIVTTTAEVNVGETALGETIPVNPEWPWFHTSIFDLGAPNRRGVDDDGDGLIDEDDLDSLDNDGDGKIDEDFGAFSESDYYFYYTDTGAIPGLSPRPSLGIKVVQRSYAWANLVREPILPFDMTFINVGGKLLRDVFIALDIGAFVGPAGIPNAYLHNYVGYWPEVRTAYMENPDEPLATPIGFTVLSTPVAPDSGSYRFLWDYFTIFKPMVFWCSYNDTCRYNLISGQLSAGIFPPIQPSQKPGDLSKEIMALSFGPISSWPPGDTLRMSFAVVSGQSLRFGPDNLYENAERAHILFSRGYRPVVTLPAPKLQLQRGEKSVHITWPYLSDDRGPFRVWDDASLLAQGYPPEHWRRRDPPSTEAAGGRIFEGFRLYRSEDPAGTVKSFTLLRQWDMIDSVGPKYEYDTGIDTSFVDSPLRTGKTYWYSITSFGIPDYRSFDYLDADSRVKRETLYVKSTETSVLASRKRVNISFAPSSDIDKVLVVPNPYRTDREYTYESGGWEGRNRTWTENRRLIRFIHLPPSCTIRIYSLSGDVVTTLHHDNLVEGELDWDLLSESGRAIASGVYVFTVESDYGKQIGKFVVIR